jgi:acyl-CoA synthetase (AMP-forming)/AMP-acid ligase II
MRTNTNQEDAMIKFYWNGIKENSGKLQTCWYSDGKLTGKYPEGTITIYKRDYVRFSNGIQEAFAVMNDTDIMTDYIQTDMIRVMPNHPLYADVAEAMGKAKVHNDKRNDKYIARAAAHSNRLLAGVI